MLATEPRFRVVGQASTIGEGIQIIKQTEVDVVLLDISLGMPPTKSFMRIARAAGFTGKVLVVTAGVSKVVASRLLEEGCSGIILKHEAPSHLIDTIRAVARGSEPVIVPAGDAEKHSGNATLRPLTSREREVLRGVFAGRTNKEIAFDLGVSEPLVKAVVHQLFNKTGVRSRSQLVRIALERYWRDLE